MMSKIIFISSEDDSTLFASSKDANMPNVKSRHTSDILDKLFKNGVDNNNSVVYTSSDIIPLNLCKLI